MINDYLGNKEYIEGIGDIYPISVVDYNRFKYLAEKYLIPDKHTIEESMGQSINGSLLDIVMDRIKVYQIAENEDLLKMCVDPSEWNIYKQIANQSIENKMLIDEFKEMLEMTLKCKVVIDDEDYKIKIEKDILDDDEINSNNFEEYRKVVMRQNLLFAPLYYDDFVLQSMLEQLRKQRRNSKEESADLEAILQIISIKKGINPKDFNDYTYYQVMAEFSRLQLLENYDWVKLVQTSGFGSKDVKIPKYDKKIDLNKHPEEIDFNKSALDKTDLSIQDM